MLRHTEGENNVLISGGDSNTGELASRLRLTRYILFVCITGRRL